MNKANSNFLNQTMKAASTLSDSIEKTFFNVSPDPETLPLFSPDLSNPSGPWVAAFSWDKSGDKEAA